MSTARPAVLATNYYTSTGTTGTGALSVLRHFAGQDTSVSGFDRNDLSGGYLPDDRSGELIGVMFRFIDPAVAGSLGTMNDANVQVAQTAIRQRQRWLEQAELAVLVNSVEIIRGPVWAFPGPPSWTQGQFSLATAAASSNASCQNSGYMLAAIAHPVSARQSVQVQIRKPTRGTVDNLTTAALYAITLQFADRKPIAV
jgi:hypothetical protein